MKYLLTVAAIIGGLTLYAQSSTELTVMTYNLLNFPNPSNNSSISDDAARASYFRQIVEDADADVIIIQEMKDISGATLLVNELNTNGTLGKTYNHAPSFFAYGSSDFALGNMLIYNDDILDLIAQQELPRSSTSGPNGSVITPRATSRYQMEITNSCSGINVPVEFYSAHFKAGSDEANGNEIADRELRDLGATDLMNFINTLASNTNMVVAGDFNFYSDNLSGSVYSEPAYVTMTSGSNTQQLYDKLGGWTRNTSGDAYKFTQSTRGAGESIDLYGNDGIPGGLDDRFDHIFINPAINDNQNMLSYVLGTYQTYGSPGILNSDATAGIFPLENELKIMSDHYPVIMKLSVCEQVVDACPAPSGVLATNISDTSAELVWTSDANSFQIEWGQSGFSPGSGTSISGISNSYPLGGLSPLTTYDYYVCAECIDTVVVNSSDLIITGAFDGPLSGGTPKGIELYVLNDISDISVYGVSSANNGFGATGSPEFSFPAISATAGTYLYITSEGTSFSDFFGFNADYVDSALLINGDDAIELFQNGIVVDVFGDVNTDGTNTTWEYLDGWAYRKNELGSNGGVFVSSNWLYSGTNQLEGGLSNATTNSPFPSGSYLPPTPGTTVMLSECAGPFTFTTGISCLFSQTLSGNINSGIYQVSNNINADGVVPNGGNVQIKAGQIICLEQGFSVGSNTTLSVEIDGCN